MLKKILFVDDEPDVMRVAVFRLRRAGYKVMTAVNGVDALAQVKKFKPNLVFLDVRLPRLSGEEACRRIKGDPASGRIPVILFTASLRDLEKKVKEACADDYLTKPFETDQLFEKVEKYIG